LIRGKILSPSSRKKRLRESLNSNDLKTRNKNKKQLSPHNSMFEIKSIFRVDEEQPDTPHLSSLIEHKKQPAPGQDMNTSLTTKISNHILDNEIIIRKKSIN
jgi:hypothetical protein